MELPREWLRADNILRLSLPHAAAPASLEAASTDQRKLGVRVAWLEIRKQ
jgi:hypothetical protein